MTELDRDLDNDWEELKDKLDKGDVLKGFLTLAKLGGEIAVAITVITAVYAGLTYITGGLALLGLPLLKDSAKAVCMQGTRIIVEQYANLSREDRKHVRDALRFLGIRHF